MADKLKRSATKGGALSAKAATRRDRDDALRLQAAGTHGDTVLAHINPAEARLLDQLADGLLDGGGRNPTTGLLSFGMSDGESGGFGGSSGNDSNPGGVGGGPAGGQTGGGIGGNTDDGQGGRGGGYGDQGYQGSVNQKRAEEIGNYYRDTYIEGMLDNPYAPKDTWQRVWQEFWNPSIAPPGRYSPPTAAHPGIMGSFLSQITPSLSLGPVAAPAFGIGMNIGGAMGRASSPATQAASAAEMSERGAQNSTGQDRDSSTGLSLSEMLGSQTPGTASGAAGLLGDALPGQSSGSAVPTMDPATAATAGMLGGTDSGAHTKSGLPQPVENLLMDYIWRGRQGSGFGW